MAKKINAQYIEGDHTDQEIVDVALKIIDNPLTPLVLHLSLFVVFSLQ